MLQVVETMEFDLDNVRISKKTPIMTPREVRNAFPLSHKAKQTVLMGRKEIENIIIGRDNRFLMIVGPCSIHDPESAYEYAARLNELRLRYADKLCVIMRSYFEKPRTTIGWKGLMSTPSIVGPSDFDAGRLLGREILLKINELGLPVATEILDPSTPQVFSDLIAWGAIGARTTESQSHREMASGLSFPVGIKNGTGGSVEIAINAMLSAAHPHTFLGIDEETGRQFSFESTGNQFSQLILRGGTNGPNYDVDSVVKARQALVNRGLSANMVVDCSHANAEGDFRKQYDVLQFVLKHRHSIDYPVSGVMIESHLVEGRQDPAPLSELQYGQSVTDACIGFELTKEMLGKTYESLG